MADESRQRLRLDTEKVYVDVIDVQRHHRQPGDHFARQQRTAAGEANTRGNVAGRDGFFKMGVKGGGVQRAQRRVNGDNQFAFRLKMAQA